MAVPPPGNAVLQVAAGLIAAHRAVSVHDVNGDISIVEPPVNAPPLAHDAGVIVPGFGAVYLQAGLAAAQPTGDATQTPAVAPAVTSQVQESFVSAMHVACVMLPPQTPQLAATALHCPGVVEKLSLQCSGKKHEGSCSALAVVLFATA